jgi:adenine-specific DNA-methyltransferase
MQVGLIQRYLGNKSAIAPEIVETVRSLAKPGDLVVDGFSGSLAVSAELRSAGFSVSCNDVNHFSWAFANAFFSGSQPYAPNGRSVSAAERLTLWTDLAAELTAPYEGEVPQSARRHDVFENYCEEGGRSAFESARGTSGRRRFFSTENAHAIDRALSRIRFWWLDGRIDERTRCILSAMLASATEKVSNTQGTFHDFPRDFVDSRALKPIKILAPPDSLFYGTESRWIGKCEDTLEFIRRVPRHKVLYLDPPYNFRQYTSYYFMLNLLTRYADIEDIDSYFDGIRYVRGQNMDDDFNSTFCSAKRFIPSLRVLIERADVQHIVLSYFDGRNHWGAFKAEERDVTGAKLLEEFLRSDLFEPNSFECRPVDRLNYQSYGGFKAKPVQEFLFSARKASISQSDGVGGGIRWTGRGLA